MCKKELKEKRRTTMKKPFLNSFPKEFTNLFLLNIFLFFLSATGKRGAGMALVTTRQCGIAVNTQTWATPAL